VQNLIFSLATSYRGEQMARHFYEFGSFRLDATRRVLFRGKQTIPLAPKVADTLRVLVENAGNVVGKEELIQNIWRDSFVEEGSLTRTISILRKALQDGSGGKPYIDTISKRGYRFVADVHITETDEPLPADTSSPAVTSPEQPASGARTEATKSRLHPRVAILGSVAILAAALFSFNLYGWRDLLFGDPGSAGIRSIAVLPLENISHDPEQEYFADGMTEALITDLAKISSLRVVSRTSVMQYKGVHKPVPQIARELGVDAVIEGTVLRSGKQVRITAQLIRAKTERHLWAEMYDRNLDDALRLQGQLAQAIADQIRIHVTPGERARLSNSQRIDPEIYELYLKGRYYWNKRDAEGLKKAMEYFQLALDKDPNFALGYVGLADSYSVLADSLPISYTETLTKAKAASLKALQLDDNLAEAHASLAFVHYLLDWDWPAAESEFRRAIELNPGYATAHHWYSMYLSAMNRCPEAISEFRRAQQLDPLSLIIRLDGAADFYFCHQLDSALEEARQVIEMAPEYPKGHFYIAILYASKGMFNDGVAEFHRGIDLAGGGIQPFREFEAWLYAADGRTEDALRVIDELQRSSPRAHLESYNIAVAYAALGNRDAAFQWLERSYREHSVWMTRLNVDPRADPLHGDPRFHDLLNRMQLD
jgi:TolB-like protein/DNA-binding winged helix-turn-helix (wHTH) protein/Tfp pilus assembly protein PilF